MQNHTEVYNRIRMLDCLYKRWDQAQTAWFNATKDKAKKYRHMLRCRAEYDRRVASPEGLPKG